MSALNVVLISYNAVLVSRNIELSHAHPGKRRRVGLIESAAGFIFVMKKI